MKPSFQVSGALAAFAFIFLAAAEPAFSDSPSDQMTVQFSPSRIHWNPHHAFNTTEAQIFTALYEGLVTFNPATLRPDPGAAESWAISEDGSQITFTLRKNLLWSNGTPISAEDFKDSWLALLSPETDAEFASLLDDIVGARDYRTGNAGPEAVGISTPDSRTLVVNLKHPSPQFLSILCHYTFVPLYRDFRRAADWSALKSIPVSGPYIIKARDSDVILLEKNPYYWDKDSVQIPKLRFLFISESAEIMNLFNRSRIDWITSGIDASELSLPKALTITPLFSTTYYYFSTAKPAWGNSEIRRALALLLPWNLIRKNKLTPATSLVPPIPGYTPASMSLPPENQRMDEALKLLDEAGYPEGKGLPSLVIGVPENNETVKIMQSTWEELLGINVVVKELGFSNYYTEVQRGPYDIATLTWTGDYADPYTFLGMWTTESSLNDSGFSNAQYDSLLLEAAKLPFRERFLKLQEAEKILLETGIILPIEHYPAVNIIDRRFVGGWFPNALDIHPFKSMVLKLGFDIPGVVRASTGF